MILEIKQILVSGFRLSINIFCIALFFCTNLVYAQLSEQDSIVIINQLQSNNLDTLQLALKASKANGSRDLTEDSLQRIISESTTVNARNILFSHQLQLLDFYKKFPNTEKQSALLVSIGDFYLEEEIPEKALQYYRESEALHKRKPSPSMLLRSSNAYLILGKIDSALIFRNQILKQQQYNNQVLESIDTKRDIISILIDAQRYEKALEYNLQILRTSEIQNQPALLTIANNNIGYNYNLLYDYKSALEYFRVAEKLNKKNEYIKSAELYTNLGIVYGNLNDLNKAITYLNKAENNTSKKDNPRDLANLYHLTSTIYFINGDIHNALIYSVKSSELSNAIGDTRNLKDDYLNSAIIYEDIYEFDKALEFYQKHLNLRDSILLEERLETQAKIQRQNEIEKADKEIKLLLVNQEVQSLLINQLELEKEKLSLAGDKLKLESDRKANELALIRKEQEIKESEFKNQTLIAQQAQQELALAEQKLINQQADQNLISLKQKEALAQATLQLNQAQKQEREKEISLLTKGKELEIERLTNKQQIDELHLEREANFRYAAYGIGGLLALMMFMFLGGLLNSRRKNLILGKQKNEIEKQKNLIETNRDLIGKEKEKSDALLLNILPKETAAELKAQGFAKPQHYDEVSVLFTDFGNFTSLSEGLSAEDLIQELNKHFLAFDDICQKYNIEKIKTIGDAYMCASGLPQINKTHAKDIILAAIEMQKFVSNNNINRRKQKLRPWEMRAGIHTGPIIAGVVGSQKFTYDIWGNTVNTASRMESSGQVGEINISATTYAKVKNDFKCTFRGKVAAKHKGELDMYFVEY